MPGHHGGSVLCGGIKYLWVFTFILPSYHCSGTKNFETGPRFFENLCMPDLGDVRCCGYVVFTSFTGKMKTDEVMITFFQVIAHGRKELVVIVF